MHNTLKNPTRVVIRGLPRGINPEALLAQLRPPLPRFNHFYINKGTSTRPPVAYINFNHFGDLVTFLRKETRAGNWVEIAPNQKLIKARRAGRKDPHCNTIEKDPCYQRFLEGLARGSAEKHASLQTPLLAGATGCVKKKYEQLEKHDSLTPLLTFVMERKRRCEITICNHHTGAMALGLAHERPKRCIIFVNSAKKKKPGQVNPAKNLKKGLKKGSGNVTMEN